ncbi:MAG: sialidase family protein [Bryobacteraceae bacterium]
MVIGRRALFGLAPALIGVGRAAPAPKARIETVDVISRQPRYYHAWPTLARRRNGELVASYSGGREAHVCPFGRVEAITSRDEGRTWSWPRVLMDTPIDDRDSGIVETARGSLLVTTFTSLAYEKVLAEAKDWEPERLDRWRAVQHATSADERQGLLGAWMLRSTDGGLTWSAPFRVPVTSPHGPVAVSGGRLLYPGKRYPNNGAIGVCESTDDGVTWRWLAQIPSRAGDAFADYHELHAVETADKRIVAHIRNHNKANDRETLQSESTDGGRTWSVPRPIGVWGLPSHLLRLRDGRLLMSYGYRRDPRGNHARISEDHGRTWSEPIVLSADGTGDLGYPSTVELGDGSLLTLWYEFRNSGSTVAKLASPPLSVLRLARWSLG